ncbi:hypothetical protein BSKO_01976 [Bryopsis sp. KO-2023]|nr:hypothetical protein BSKO_01976 [Bryopsis sp. KO-2023]
MALFHLLNCVALCFLPHVVYYHATPLAEFSVLRSVIHGAVIQLFTSFGKVVVLACLLPGTESAKHDLWKDGAQVLVSLIDIVGLFFALTSKWAHRSTSNEHKFQAVGLGWAFTDSLVRRAAPMWLGGFSPEFTLDHIMNALQSNIVLIQSLSFAAIGTLVFNKRSKPASAVPFLKISLGVHAVTPMLLSLVGANMGISGFPSLGLELACSVLFALSSWKLYQWCLVKQA